jgi:hypothetical protein
MSDTNIRICLLHSRSRKHAPGNAFPAGCKGEILQCLKNLSESWEAAPLPFPKVHTSSLP